MIAWRLPGGGERCGEPGTRGPYAPPMTTVAEVMTPCPFVIMEELSLTDALARMSQHGIRHLPVFAGSHLVGIVSERDVAVVSSIDGVDPNKTMITEAMTEHPYTVGPRDGLKSVVTTMVEKKFGAAIVMDQGDLKGIFTTVDGMRKLAELL